MLNHTDPVHTPLNYLFHNTFNIIPYFTGPENRDYGCRDPLRWLRDILYLQKLALISPTSGGRSVGTDRSRTKATEL
jgi:hypothetical protein